MSHKKTHSQDSACDSSGEIEFGMKRDDASIYSTTSSVFSTASRMSKIPNAVKSSVKYLVRRNKNRQNDTMDHETLGSKIKRTTINFSLFRKQKENAMHEIIPSSSSSNTPYTHPEQPEQVGTCLSGKQVDDLDFLVPDTDTKSEKMVQKREEPWMRQRAKSCQENKAPMLRQLATKGSSTKLVIDLPQHDPIPYKSSHKMLDLPLFKGLVTTTLTTLHTRLINECDRTLSTMLMANNNPPSQTNPQEQLLSVISDLRKMTEMVNWENQQDKKDHVKEGIQQLEQIVLHQELTIISVKDIISTIKHIMNQCICQYYKVVEKAIVIPSKGYRIEGINKYDNHSTLIPSEPVDYSTSPIDHKDPEAHWYRTYFLDSQDVYTFFGYDHEQEPVLISIKAEQDPKQYRVIYRTKKNPDQRRIIPDTFLLNTFSSKDTLLKTIVETVAPGLDFHQLRLMSGEQMISTGLQDELVRLDENSLHTRYKFGVLLVKENQTKEEEWFSNENDSSAFHEFLDIIGRKIELKGYSGWAAGLDTKGGDSGEFCYTNQWNENNLAYHVSTLLPSKAGDKQQIQRKRHIGNDIVCLVFVEGKQPFNPTAIKSQFLHVFIIVHKESWKDTHAWRVEIVSVEDVPPFGPPLPGTSAVFFDKKELESYLVAKLVNAEYAAFKSPKFALPMNRAREGIFTNLVEKGHHMLRTEETESTEELKEDTVKNHTKSPSTSSSISSIISPTPSKSNAIREFSENIVSLGRRRSTQDLAEKPKNSNSKQLINKKSLAKNNKFAEGSKRSRSEQDLMNVTLDHTIVKQSFKNRAQNILTSFPGFGGHGQDDP